MRAISSCVSDAVLTLAEFSLRRSYYCPSLKVARGTCTALNGLSISDDLASSCSFDSINGFAVLNEYRLPSWCSVNFSADTR